MSNMQTALNNQNNTVVKHSTKTCRLTNILKGRLHSLFQRKNLLRLSDICPIIPRLCAGILQCTSLNYWLHLRVTFQHPPPTKHSFTQIKGASWEHSKIKQLNSSYHAYAMYPNLTYLILTAIFHFSLNCDNASSK